MQRLIGVTLALLMFGSVVACGDVPTPSEDVMLTVSGTIALRNAGKEFRFDRQLLEQLPANEYEVDDPWLRGTQAYRGVELKFEHALEYPIFIVYELDGESINSDDGGPVKLVFPYHVEGVRDLYSRQMWAWYVVETRVEY